MRSSYARSLIRIPSGWCGFGKKHRTGTETTLQPPTSWIGATKTLFLKAFAPPLRRDSRCRESTNRSSSPAPGSRPTSLTCWVRLPSSDGRSFPKKKSRAAATLWCFATEVALALVLLSGAGLMMKSLVQMNDIDPGVRTQNVLTMDLSLPEVKYPDASGITLFFRDALERIEALPGVRSAGITTTLPLQGSRLAMPIEVAGSTYTGPVPNLQRVSPGYFHAMGIELLEGRWLTDRDTETSARVAVVNETFVNRL